MTKRRRNPPSQKPLPLPHWPETDREAWLAAQETSGVLYDGGVASHLRAHTRSDLTRRYAYFLSFLAHRGRLEEYGPAASSVSPENILDYVHYLEPRVSSVTLAQSLYKIRRVAVCLAPELDWRWLRRLSRRLDLRAKPRDRRNDVVEIKELFWLGRQLMGQADKASTSTAFSRVLLYRDGLIIALLAADPLRSANITALEIGRTLIKDGTTWSFDIPAEETKAGRPHLAILPDWSAPCIDRYVDHYRLLFRNAETTCRLWLSRNGRPLDDSSLYHLVCKRTCEAFGKPINPHLFRSCLATSTAVHHGAEMGLAMTVLGHQSSKVTTRHYNQAKMIDAVRAYQEVLLADPQGRG
jgi:integrase/recombinase XerD